MCPRIPWEQVTDPKGSAEHTSVTTALHGFRITAVRYKGIKSLPAVTFCQVRRPIFFNEAVN